MIIRHVALIASLLILANTTALADELPRPATDYQGEWVSPESPDSTMIIHYSADKKTMLITQKGKDEKKNGMLHDLKTGQIIVWNERMPGQALSMNNKSKAVAVVDPTGQTKTVNGEKCTIWTMEDSSVCLSKDNIVLQGSSQLGIGSIQRLKRVSQDESLFSVPDGLKIISMPAAMQEVMGSDHQ